MNILLRVPAAVRSPLLYILVTLTMLVSSAPSAEAQASPGALWAWGNLTRWSAPTPVSGGPRLDRPTQINAISNAAAVSVGGGHVLLLKTDGTVWAWGNNEYGQLGTGDTANRDAPVMVVGLPGATAIAAGQSSSFAVASDGSVWGWGGSFLDAGLRIPGQMARPVPVQISGLSGVTAIAATVEVLALEGDGTVWETQGYVQEASGPAQIPPLQIEGLDDVTAIAQQGGSATLALRGDGSVWTWGDNSSGALGRDPGQDNGLTPLPVPGLTDVTALAAGLFHSLALRKDGTVWAWGNNGDGQLGSGPIGNRSRQMPAQVNGLNGVTAVAAGQNYSLALTGDGSVWAWGNNTWGQIADGAVDPNPRPAPVRVRGVSGAGSIWAGTYATESFAITGNPQPAPAASLPAAASSQVVVADRFPVSFVR